MTTFVFKFFTELPPFCKIGENFKKIQTFKEKWVLPRYSNHSVELKLIF